MTEGMRTAHRDTRHDHRYFLEDDPRERELSLRNAELSVVEFRQPFGSRRDA